MNTHKKKTSDSFIERTFLQTRTVGENPSFAQDYSAGITAKQTVDGIASPSVEALIPMMAYVVLGWLLFVILFNAFNVSRDKKIVAYTPFDLPLAMKTGGFVRGSDSVAVRAKPLFSSQEAVA
jgi:hypothetical protein